MRRLVADTGPMLHLNEAGALELLPRIGAVVLGPLVLAEVRARAPALWPKALPDWLEPHILSQAAQQRATRWQQAGLLHSGEAEALALALELAPDWFLTDDAAARLMAELLNVETHGSLGVVLWAAANKVVTRADAEAYLSALEGSSLWISPRVRTAARGALQRIFNS